MRLRFKLTHLLALVVLGSGLINIFSVIGPALPERAVILHGLFPLEFLHLSRFFTLLIGFALIISSINIYRRKKRALHLVLLLTALSVIFHLTKGLDYEEAACSGLLLVVLFLSRGRFHVQSSVPDLRWGVARLMAALGTALLYGVAGFWLLDRREFHIDFSIGDALYRTLLFLSLIGDPAVTPHTRYARWFLESMYLTTAVAIAYSLYAIFRPVVYRYRTLPHERELAQRITEQHGRSAIDFFKYWPDKTFFFSDSHRSFIAYKVGGGYAMALGDPIGPDKEIEPLIREFSRLCEQNDWRVAFHQTLPDFLPVYKRLGFRKLKIGDDAVVDLSGFSLDGKQAKKMRHTVNQLEKEGIGFLHYPAPIGPDILEQAREVSDAWLRIPGRRERTFSLGMFDPDYVRRTPIYAAVDASGRMLSFVNIIPSFCKGEATIDLMRYRVDAPGGLMDYLLVKLFLAKKQEGYTRFNLGMAPMAGFQEKEEASMEERAVHNFMQHMNFIFSYQGLRAYKAKYATSWEPRYVIYRSILNLPLLARAIGEVTELHE